MAATIPERRATGWMENVWMLSYHACMSSLLQVREVPDEMRRALKARAASRGQSLNSYMLDVIAREVARPTVAEVLERAAARTERATGSAVDVLDGARQERDAALTRRAGA
jgi:plasmid stability protein